jgi:hypothetical protein
VSAATNHFGTAPEKKIYLRSGKRSERRMSFSTKTFKTRHDMLDAPSSPATATKWEWFYFFALGTLNNFGYVVVLSAAASLASGFGGKNLIGVVQWANGSQLL